MGRVARNKDRLSGRGWALDRVRFRRGGGLWVQAFPSGPGKWRVAENGTQPHWSHDGSELYYGAETLMVARVQTSPTDGASPVMDPEPLFSAQINSFWPFYGVFFWDVSRDGQRFLIDAVEPGTNPIIYVVTGWDDTGR